MHPTPRRTIAVAVAVCAFAVGMAGLLNYFKYRATTERLLEQRLAHAGRSVANNIQASLSLGLQLGDIGTLPALLLRSAARDERLTGIDVFDTEGRTLYSTDAARLLRVVPAAWQARARQAGDGGWTVHDDLEPAVAVAVQNHFGLTVGHVALRYSRERVHEATRAVMRELALAGVGVLAIAAALATFALRALFGRLDADVRALEQALRAPDALRGMAALRRGAFGEAPRRFAATVADAETQIAAARRLLRAEGLAADVDPAPPHRGRADEGAAVSPAPERVAP